MPKRMDDPLTLLKILPVVMTVMSFVIGIVVSMVGQSYWMGKNMATVDYVDQRHTEAMKYSEKLGIENKAYAEKLAIDNKIYADKLNADVKQQAFDHSDLNKKDMSIRIEAFGTKLDLMLDTVKTIQSQMYDSNRRR
jgi:hypothetical protein